MAFVCRLYPLVDQVGSDLNKESVLVEFNHQKRVIDFKTLFKSDRCSVGWRRLKSVFSRESRLAVLGTEDPFLKVIDTAIPIPCSGGKTLRFYVRKHIDTDQPEGNCSYDFWPKNIKRLGQKSSSNRLAIHTSKPELIIKLDNEPYLINSLREGYGSRWMIPIRSSLPSRDERKVYSATLIGKEECSQKIVKIRALKNELDVFLRDNPLFLRYSINLALPDIIKSKEMKRLQKVSLHSIMKNGMEGNLAYIQKGNKTHYELRHLRGLYEALLFLFAAGYSHGGVCRENIVKNDEAFLWIDFSETKRISDHSSSIGGDFRFISLNKFMALRRGDHEFNPIENDLYGFCLSILYPYIPLMEYLEEQHLFHSIRAIHNPESIFRKIESDHPEGGAVPDILCEMFKFCRACTFGIQNEEEFVPEFLCTLAFLMGIKDRIFMEKVLVQSNYPKGLIDKALERYQKID